MRAGNPRTWAVSFDYFLLPPGRGGGGGLALVVGSNLPPFFGSKVPAMVIPLVRFDSSTTAHRNHVGKDWGGFPGGTPENCTAHSDATGENHAEQNVATRGAIALRDWRGSNTPGSVATRSREDTYQCIAGHIGNIDH